ncbi:MAG: hypothetical protein K0U86_23355 [Planctomycetes bacterium]|nr:hypothetical protein [Planctomycetota bacterium]MCH9727850.1 hypothetical protein [Planctomycetota bacterium]MCH9775482.1 hypothetical protein [Planctomycetota bacterium]MCH9790526.1 hypothetical protein [Planctomycetota bacterium]MDF1744381.1 hypothetical protein [Gimesia sp.]
MNQIDGQLAGALFIVAGAVFFLTRRILRFFKQRSGCSGSSCTGCEVGAVKTPDFVSLDQLKHSE